MIFDTDKTEDVMELRRLTGANEVLPRRSQYGTALAETFGLTPIEARLDTLIPESEFRDAVEHAREVQSMPIFHAQKGWRKNNFLSNQARLGYCWTWSASGCILTKAKMQDLPPFFVSPVSMGYLVGWQNRGNYLESVISGLQEDGICLGDFNDPRNRASAWSGVPRPVKLGDTWDTDKRNMVQHAISGLCAGCPGQIAYMWWGHALELVGIRWEGGRWIWEIGNSHNDPYPLELTGSRAIPDELYFYTDVIIDADHDLWESLRNLLYNGPLAPRPHGDTFR